MVLSNKKLKQKLREALAESATKPESKNPNSDSNSLPHPHNDLNHIIDSVSQKLRLSKRKKRRQSQPPTAADAANTVDDVSEKQKSESGDGLKIKKRRNQISEDGEEKNVEKEAQAKKKLKKTTATKKSDNEVEKEDESVKKAKKKLKKKKKNKKKTAKKNVNEVAKVIVQEPVAAEPDKDAGESQVQEEVTTKVYVGGIPYYSTEEDIQSYFEGCGTITEIDCMSFPDSGKFRGIAIIDFKTEGAAKRALALDGSEMGELSLKILPYKTAARTKKSADFAPKFVEGYNRIYAGNLSWDITEDDLRKLFSDCNISSIRWGSDKETGDFRGYAHVDFSDSLSLTKALKLDQHVVCERPVKISCAVALKGGKANSIVETTPSKSMAITEAAGTGGLNSVPAATSNDVEKSWVTSKDADNVVVISKDVDDSGVSAGKMRRRTCYECGGKGHISSDCPKKQTVTPSIANTSNDVEKSWVTSKDAENSGVTSKDADNVVVISKDVDDSGVSAGKMRRRTCYECGGKGHISSACPKKQTASPSIANTS